MAAPGPWRTSAPYPPYPRNAHAPPEPGRPHPYAAPQSQPYYASGIQASAVPGFYNPALPRPPVQSLPPGPPPVFPQPRMGLPSSLVPGRNSTYSVPRSHSNDFFFQGESSPPSPYRYLQHTRTEPPPPLPRKPTALEQPPLPPKPPLPTPLPNSPGFPSSQTSNGLYFTSPEPSPAPSAPPLPQSGDREDEDALLNRVLEISAKETRLPQPSGEPSEEEQIARALQESLKINQAPLPLSSPPPDRQAFITASPEPVPSPLPHPSPSYASPSNSVKPLAPFSQGCSKRVSASTYIAKQISADEALARRLQDELEEEERQQSQQSETQRPPSRSPPIPPSVTPPPPSRSPSVPSVPSNVALSHSPSVPSMPSNVAPSHSPPILSIPPNVVESAHPEADLPLYDDVVSSPPPTSSAFYNTSLATHFPTNGTSSAGFGSQPGPSSSGTSLYRSISEKPVTPKSCSPEPSRLGRSQSLGETSPASPVPSTHLAVPPLPAPTPQAPRSQAVRPVSLASPTLDSIEESKPGTPASASSCGAEAGPSSSAQYLDAEFLAGLSLGFGTPAISASLKPFESVIPNVIALPYGRCPPFHIRAPSWRNLLKLMARLSGTRLEPTLEAQAVVKTEMKLRVVVSFVKVHHASSEWHTVLYMTIDHPVPPNAPNGWKQRNGDTNTLPFSYTLSQLPAFLRDGSDAPLSKFYTIPLSNEVPYPTLPISFPNLATYLASALEISRDAHDPSGVRRLAKLIDQFYPSDRVTDDQPERMGMRRRLKNLVGIGSRQQRDRNAEMYELVTPFVPDEYGH